LLAYAVLVLCCALAFAADNKTDEQALLALHAQDRQAYLKGDADLLVSSMAPEIIDVGRGNIDHFTRDQFRDRLAKFFAQAKYSSWEDASPPVVRIGSDGRSALMAVRMAAKLTMSAAGKPPENLDFQSAWLASYEKQNGKWVMVA